MSYEIVKPADRKSALGNTRGETLLALRYSQGETQAQCAERIAYSVQTTVQWEKGINAIKDTVWTRILRDYGVTAKTADAVAAEFFEANPRGQPVKGREPFKGLNFVEWAAHPITICTGFDEDGDAVYKTEHEIEVKVLRGMKNETKGRPSNQITQKDLGMLRAALEPYVISDETPQNMEISKTKTSLPDADLV